MREKQSFTEHRETQEAPRAGEQGWRDLTEALPQLVWSAMPDGSCDYFSAQWTEHTGVPEPDLLGWRWLETLHPDDREPTRTFWLESVAEHHPYDIEYRVRRRDGEYRWFKTRGVPVRDSNGIIIKWFGTGTDITELRETQEALHQANARLDLAVRGSNIGIWECDVPDGHIENSHLTLINVWESLGYDAQTSPTDFPSTFALLFHPDDQERVGRELQELFASDGQGYESEYRVRTKDGSTRWHLARGTVLRDPKGKPIRFIGTSTDITDLKRAEEARRQANERVNLAARSSDISIWECDMPDGHIENAHLNLFNVWESLGYDPRTSPTDFASAAAVFFHPDDLERVGREIQELLASDGQDWKNEYRALMKDGSTRWILARGTVLRDPDRKPVRFIGTSTDITDRKRAEEALRERERQLDSLMGHLPGLAYRALADDHWTALFVSKGIEDLAGYPPDEFTSRRLNYAEIMLPEDRPATREAVFSALRERRMYEAEHRIRHKDGSIRWIWARGHGVFAPDGSLSFIEGLNLDMTSRKQAEEALRESEERFRGTFENAAVGIAHTHPTGQFLRVNETFCAILGYPREELLGKKFQDITHPDDLATSTDLLAALMRGDSTGYATEKRYLRKDGTPVWAELVVSLQRDAAGEPAYAIGVIQDISERKRLEEEVRLATARLELALRGSNIGFWDIDMHDGDLRNSRISYVNVWEQLGYERPDSPKDQETGMALVHPDDRVAHAEAVRRYLAGETSEFEVESRVCHKDGSFRWMISRGVAVRDAAGKPIRFLGTGIDITDRKRAEEALRESEERFRGTFENAAVGIIHSDSTGQILRVNQKFCAMVGYSREELLHKNLHDIVNPDELNAHLENYESIFARNAPPAFGVERRNLRRDGTTVWLEAYVSLQHDASGRPEYAIAAVHDISERKKLDEELRRAKESAEAANRAKDEFLANVSHEIRTPMNAILGMTDLALDSQPTEYQQQCLTTVKVAGENLLTIINDLLDFAKIEAGKLELDLADFSLRSTIGDTLRSLAVRAHKKGLELIYDVHPDVPDALVGDAGRLRQVLLNLVGNAIKFTDKGEVVVRLEMANELGPAPRDVGKVKLRFTVRDTGIGVPRNNQERIFAAFEQEDTSTTRKYGGTGLGLTISARLVALMDGRITVESEPNIGSTFAFTASFSRQTNPIQKKVVRSRIKVHDRRVLVVDDNATNRHILEEWLHDWQMKPASVANGVAALGALMHGAASGARYELILLDYQMPDMDGLALSAKIRALPELQQPRIILLTSGERIGDLSRFRDLQINAYLLKPIEQEQLLEKIIEVISRTDEKVKTVSQPVKPGEKQPARSRPLRILVAEDNEFNVELLEQLLTKRGHHVQIAKDGRQALSAVLGEQFDLLLLDMHMPELDGFQVADKLREHERQSGGHLPVIALTARSRKEDREQCLAAGMDDFLAKPIQSENLWAAIDRLLGEQRSENQAKSELLTAKVLLSACGGNGDILAKLCHAFEGGLPGYMSALRDALRNGEPVRLRQTAHKFCGMIGTFSTQAGSLASQIEDLAAAAQIEECRPLVDRLEQMSQELLKQLEGISIEKLRNQLS